MRELSRNVNHVMPILRGLHWLPVQKCILHKIISATYRSVQKNTGRHTPSRLLMSAFRSVLGVPRPRDSKVKRCGQRTFRYVAPSLWDVLPESIKEKDPSESFRVSLKTHFTHCQSSRCDGSAHATVCGGHSHWCACGVVYNSINTLSLSVRKTAYDIIIVENIQYLWK